MAALLVRANGFVYLAFCIALCCFDCVLTVFDDWYTVVTLLVHHYHHHHRTFMMRLLQKGHRCIAESTLSKINE